MKKYFIYLVFYSVGGFVLERVVNFFFYGGWYDNSVLFGPYQPLYGTGVLITIIFYDHFYYKSKLRTYYKDLILLAVAVIATGLVELITGYGFEIIFNLKLWDYREFFPCNLRYVCIIPTGIFGIISYLVVKYLHPLFERHLSRVNKWLYYGLLVIFIIDIVLTLTNL